MSAERRVSRSLPVINVMSGYASQAWVMVLNLAFIPVFVYYLGVDAWGIVALLAVIQSIFGILDFGLSPMITRELAFLKSKEGKASELVDLFYTTRLIFVLIGVIGGAGIGLAGTSLFQNVDAFNSFDQVTLDRSFWLIGVICAARFIEVGFRGALFGFEKHALYNIVLAAVTTARNLGCLAIVTFVSSDVEMFLASQAIFFCLGVLILWLKTSGELPKIEGKASIRFRLILSRAHFSGHILANSLLGVALTQFDKLIVSSMVTAAEFAHFMLAATLANAVSTIVTPVTNAMFPNMTRRISENDNVSARRVFHLSCGFITLVTVPGCLVVILFPEHAIWLWSGSQDFVNALPAYVVPLMIGALLQAVIAMPMYLAYTFKKPNILTYFNLVVAVFYLSGAWVLAAKADVRLVPWLWVAVNCSYVLLLVPMIFRQTLQIGFLRWLSSNLLIPTMLGTALLMFALQFVSPPVGRFNVLVVLSALLICVTTLVLVSNSVTMRGAVRVVQARFPTWMGNVKKDD
ncbi:MAG: oligosaccharide flippase family protein [Pseudomonadota bacterium]|nr:oligosaccharide flippase family protein [Pseudomonadota bacterium]